MVKIPNFSELAEKADVAGILNKVKTIINTATAAAQPASSQLASEETLKAKVVEIELLMKQARDLQGEQIKLLNSLEISLNEMAAIVVTIKAPVVAQPIVAPVVTTVETPATFSNPTDKI